jgi:hypothetical protein
VRFLFRAIKDDSWIDEVSKMSWKISPNSLPDGQAGERRTLDFHLRTPNSELRTPNDSPLSFSLDEALLQVRSRSLRKTLFKGEGTGPVSSYVAGWMASQGMDVIVLDGANRFDPYVVSFFARKSWIPPEGLLKKIRIARAFTCYQMATLMGEKLASLFDRERLSANMQKPWVILLGPITTFLDEDVPEREAGSLLERSLKRVDALAEKGVSFFLFQSFIPVHSKRAYLVRRLFQFSNLVWKISLGEDGPQVILEKGPEELRIGDFELRNTEWKKFR